MGKRKIKKEEEDDVKPKKGKKIKKEKEEDDVKKIRFKMSKEDFEEGLNQLAEFEVGAEDYKIIEQAEELKEARETNKVWYPIVSLMHDTYQADLTFHNVGAGGRKEFVQAIFTIINVNTRFGYAQPMPYKTKPKKNEAWSGTKTENETQRVYESHPKRATTLAFVKALIWLYGKGKRVKRLFLDGGGEFAEFKAFGENPMKWIRENTTWYRGGGIPKWAEQKGTKMSLPKNIKSKPSNDDFFGKEFFLEPIKVLVFKPKEGTKRRLAIVERFNRTVKDIYQNASIADQNYRESRWEQYANRVAWQYNRTSHTGLIKIMRKIFPKEDVKEYKLNKMSPAGVTKNHERHIILGKLSQTRRADNFFAEPERRIQIGDKVKYKITDPEDVNKNVEYRNVFAKAYYGWSKMVFTVKRKTRSSVNTSVPTRTYILMNSKRQELERRFLPHELKIVDSGKKKKVKGERVSDRVIDQKIKTAGKKIEEDHVGIEVTSAREKENLDNMKWKKQTSVKKEELRRTERPKKES